MSVVADVGGRVEGQFVIPAGVPAGAKLVEFLGAQTYASASFVGRGMLRTDELRLITTVINPVQTSARRFGVAGRSATADPLAQTFMINRRRQIAAIDLWFCAIGTSNVLLQIRDVTLGIPTLDVVAEALLTPAQITLDGPTRFRFPPTVLEPNHEYALVVMCNDAVSSVWIGEIGQFDAHLQSWVTEQPYQIGVLLSSSNNRTWTPHQTKDLAFRLIAANYNVTTNSHTEGETTRVVALDPVDVVDADHLIVIASVERPSADTSVVFNVGVGAAMYAVMERQPFTLPARYTGQVTLEAVLTGTFEESPVLHRDVALVSGTRVESSDYVSRAMPALGGTKLTLYYDAITPGASNVSAHYEDDDGQWVALPIVDATQLGNGLVEVRHEMTGLDQPETRIKLVLNGTALARPRVRDLRVAII